MSDSDWSDVFFSAFVLVALAMMTIKAWTMVAATVAANHSKGGSNSPSLLPYIAVAIFITILSLIIVASIHNLSSINLQLPVRLE